MVVISEVQFWELLAPMFKVLSQQLQGTLATASERHFTVEDFTDMDQNTS